MNDPAAQKVLDAIREYEDQHGSDPKYADVVTELKATASALEEHQPTTPDTPGKDQTRRAVAGAKDAPEPSDSGDSESDPSDKNEKTESEPAKQEPPKTFAQARERAMQQSQKK